MKARSAISIIAVAISACGGTVVETTRPVASSTSSAAPATAAPTVTTIPPASTSTTVIVADTMDPLEIPRLDTGLPATFVAVTEGWEAVEVDTATGDILRSIGRMERPGEADDEAGVWAAVQQVWRSSDHLWYVVGECCEPAAGMIHYLDPETVLTRENHYDTMSSAGWTVSPSPFDGRLAKIGYHAEVFTVGEEPDVSMWLDEGYGASSMMTAAAWGPGGTSVSWLSWDWKTRSTRLIRLDLDEPDADLTSVVLDWVTDDQRLDGTGTQESGNFVAFRNTSDDDPEAPAVVRTEGVVFSSDGKLITTFPLETGSYWGGYDPSGRFLIYTDGDNNVRWQGLGQAGLLAEGFVHASW